MKKFSTLALSALVALTVAVTSSSSAFAGKRERNIAAGVIIGAIGGAIIAGSVHKKRYYKKRRYQPQYRTQRVYVQPQRRVVRQRRSRLTRWERHVIRCQRRYRTYDEYSDTFIAYSGRERRCRL